MIPGIVAGRPVAGSGPAPDPVAYVDATSGQSSTLAFGTETVLPGDLIYYWLGNQASSTVPALPSGYTSIFTSTNGLSGTSGQCAMRECWKIAGSSEAAPGVTSDVNRWMVAIFRDTHASDPFGAVDAGVSTVNSATFNFGFPSLTFENTNTTSLFLGIVYCQDGTSTGLNLSNLPSNVTQRRISNGSVTLMGVGTSGPQNGYTLSNTGLITDASSFNGNLWRRSREILAA